MTSYHARAVLLLHLTACISWQDLFPPSPPNQFIEAEQLDPAALHYIAKEFDVEPAKGIIIMNYLIIL